MKGRGGHNKALTEEAIAARDREAQEQAARYRKLILSIVGQPLTGALRERELDVARAAGVRLALMGVFR